MGDLSWDLASCETALRAHAKAYPAMAAQDAVKLLYQQVFAGGHLIEDAAKSQAFCLEEWAQVGAAPPARFEPLGGGLVRAHLGGRDRALAGRIAQAFIETSQDWQPVPGAFEEGLSCLQRLTDSGEMPFAPDQFRAYLADYRAQGCPMVSHTPQYRRLYSPHYRVLARAYGVFDPVFEAIDQGLAARQPLRVAVEGRCGSGKSTLANLLKKRYGCTVLHMDDFFLPVSRRTPERLAQPGGNVDIERFKVQVFDKLGGEAFTFQPYDCSQDALDVPVSVGPSRLTVVEGVYSLHPLLAAGYDLKVFLTLDPKAQRDRLAKRNPEMLPRFLSHWIPMEERYFAHEKLPQGCHIVINTNPTLC